MVSGAPCKPLFRAVQINDLHLQASDDPHYSREKFEALLRVINEERHAPRPDLVLSLGDVVHGANLEDNALAAQALLRLKTRGVLPTAGNHDIDTDNLPQGKAGYLRHFGADLIDYTFFYRGILFVSVSNPDADRPGAEGVERRHAWLAATLERHRELPKIILCHTPLVPMRDPEVLSVSFPIETWKVLDEQRRMERLLAEHAETVVAVLSGHIHLTAHRPIDGIHYITTSGPYSWPCDAAWFTFYPDRIEVEARAIDEAVPYCKQQAGDGFGNLIHDRDAKERPFSDAAHPDLRTYLRGTDEERAFTIPLTGKKRPRPEASLVAKKPNGFPAPDTRTRANPDGSVTIINLAPSGRMALAPLSTGGGEPAYVLDEGRSELYLDPDGNEAWTGQEVEQGVAVWLEPDQSRTLRLAGEAPKADFRRVSTAPALERDKASHQSANSDTPAN